MRRISTWCTKHPLILRFCFLTALTLMYVLLTGYQFATFDQNIHIPFVRKFITPSLYPNDPFFELTTYHFSYFWIIIAKIANFITLEYLVFFLHLVSVFLAFWAIGDFAYLVTKNEKLSYFTTLTFLFPKLSFAFFPVMEFSLLNRTFVFPFLLWTIIDFLKGNRLRAFFFAGILLNIHAISVLCALLMFGFALMRQSRLTWKKFFEIVQSLALFVLGASPVLLWKFSTPSPIRSIYSIDWEWFSLIYKGSMAHLFSPIIPFPIMLLATGSGICTLIAFFTFQQDRGKINHDVRNFVVISTIVIFGAYLLYATFPFTFLVQSQIVRIGGILSVFTIPYFLLHAYRRLQEKEIVRSSFFLIVISLITAPLMITPLFTYIAVRKKKILLAWGVTLISLFFSIMVVLSMEVAKPGIYITPENNAWYSVQFWAKENTAPDSVFLVPPAEWWFTTSDFRTLSERSTFVLFSDILEFAFYPPYTATWKSRFSALLPGVIEQFNGDYQHSFDIIRKEYDAIPNSRFIHLVHNNRIDYIVTKSDYTMPYPVVYENSGFRVFATK